MSPPILQSHECLDNRCRVQTYMHTSLWTINHMRFQEIRVNTKILHKMPYEPPQSFVRIVCKRALDAFHMKPTTKKNGDLFLFGFIGEGSLISTRVRRNVNWIIIKESNCYSTTHVALYESIPTHLHNRTEKDKKVGTCKFDGRHTPEHALLFFHGMPLFLMIGNYRSRTRVLMNRC